MVQGGYYLKGFAKHGPLHNPHAYGYFGPIAYQRAQARRPRHAGRDHLQGRRLSAVVPRDLHRRQPAVERRLLARPGARRLDVRRPARRHPDRRPRPMVPADRPARRARCRRLRRGLVRQARRPPRPARHLGPDQRPDLSRGLRRPAEARAVRPVEAQLHRAGRLADQHQRLVRRARPGASWPSVAIRRSCPS